jgi:hypothetical protein
MAKETLNIELDSGLVERLREYSEAHGTDVSETIGALIEHLPVPVKPTDDAPEEEWVRELPPLTRSLLGAAVGDAASRWAPISS